MSRTISLRVLSVLLLTAFGILALDAPALSAQVIYTVTSTGDANDANTGDGVCDDGGGECTLRAAIEQANATGADGIHFAITGAGPHIIAVGSSLPEITDPVVIDGYTQSGASPNSNPPTLGSNAIIMIEIEVSGSLFGLDISAGSSTVRGLAIHGPTQRAIRLLTAGENVIEGNFIGTNAAGDAAPPAPSGFRGVEVDSPNNTIGGTTAAARNVIVAPGTGVLIQSGATGTAVQGNLLGTNAAGDAGLGVSLSLGVNVLGENTTIGGTAAGAGNVISNHVTGVNIVVDGAVVQGNLIGTNVSGTAAIRTNGTGISVNGSATGTIIGGTTPAARNIVSGGSRGIRVFESTVSNTTIQGNYIGLDITGTTTIGNSSDGIALSSGSSLTTIGGTAPGAGNVISGSGDPAIRIGDSHSNTVQGNLIGTDASGEVALGNDFEGVYLDNNSSNNLIGGTEAGAGNTVVSSTGIGVAVVTGTGNAILGNSIYGSGSPGIDLGYDDVTANDAGDGDTGGNNLQNFPELSLAITGSAEIEGTFNSAANSTFRLEFFSNDGCSTFGFGEGQRYLGFTEVTTDGSGNASFSASLDGPASPGDAVTATATDASNNTSEFSQCVTGVGYDVSASASAGTVIRGDDASYDVTVTAVAGTLDRDVTLSCDGLPAGASCTFTPTTVQPGATSAMSSLVVSTTNPGTPTGSNGFDVVGTVGAVERTAAATVTVTDFTVAATPDNVTVTAGQSAGYTVTVSPDGPSFAGTVALSCSGLPAGASCTFAPAEVTPGADAVTSMLTLSTAAVTSDAGPVFTGLRPHLPAGRWGLVVTLAALILAAVLRTAGRRPHPARVVAGVLVFLALAAVACGGDPNGPPPSVTFTVTGTSGALIRSTTATVTVQ